VDDYLAKPFQAAELIARVRVAMERARGRREAVDPDVPTGPITVPPAVRPPTDVRTLVPVSFVLSSVGYAIAAFTGHPTVLSVLVAFTVLGIGIGLAETITNDLILSSVPPQKAGAASAISETAYEIGAVLGTAVLGTVLTATFRENLTIPAVAKFGEQQNAFQTLGSTLDFATRFSAPVEGWIHESAAAAFDLGVQVTAGAAIFVALAAAWVSRRTLRLGPR